MDTAVKKIKKKMKSLPVILVMIILLCIIGFLILQMLKIAKASATEAYKETVAEVTQKTSQEYYDWAFQKAEEEYHVSNRVVLSIGDIKKQSKLEVLKVSDVEFIIHNADENGDNVTVWTAIPGNGVFTVDMSLSEFLLDNERHIIVARLPIPQLTGWSIDYDNIEIYNFDTGRIFNGNYSQGEAVAREQFKEGEEKIKNEFLSKQRYLNSAEESARILVTKFIRNLNPDIADLKVEIEFMD